MRLVSSLSKEAADSLNLMADAEAAYQKALSLEPEHPRSLHGMGVILKTERRYDEAIDYLGQAIEHDPAFLHAHYTLGLIYGAQGRYPDAITTHMNALAVDRNFSQARYALEVTYNHASPVGSCPGALRHPRSERVSVSCQTPQAPSIARSDVLADVRAEDFVVTLVVTTRWS
jgi:tetratricopeptide (TPR) repeat protein